MSIPVQDQPKLAGTSVFNTLMSMCGILVGLGQLSIAYAVANGGWVSIFLLVGLGATCAYTSCLLGDILLNHGGGDLRTYADIGYLAYGRYGRVVVIIFIYLEVFLSLVSATISLHDNLGTLLQGIDSPVSVMSTSNFYTIILIVFLGMPSVWMTNISKISYLSSFGIISSVLLFISVAITPAFGVQLNQKISSLNIMQIPTVSGLYIFCFSAHMVIPDIITAMQKPASFKKVSAFSFASSTLVYVTVGLLGARMFGPKVAGQITLSMPKHSVATKIALIATTATPLTKYAFEVFPIGVGVEKMLPASMSRQMRRLVRRTVVTFFLLAVLILALLVPQFQNVLALTGCIVSFGISIIIPCVMYLKVSNGTSTASKILLVAIIATASILGVLGTVTTTKSLVENM